MDERGATGKNRPCKNLPIFTKDNDFAMWKN
jgi:hypothetical protein